MTLSPAIIVEVARLLAETDLTQRAIALRTGVSRATVNSTATGKRPVARLTTAREVCVTGSVDRCPDCGSNSQISPEAGICFACQVRRLGGKATKPGGAELAKLDIVLYDETQARYEVVRLAARKRWLPRSPVDKPAGPR